MVSIALVMFLSVLPDIDIIFRLAGLELGHRTVTHSAILWITIGGALLLIILFFTKKYRQVQAIWVGGALVYLIAYLSHIIIGDTILGPINILYPFGDFVVNSTIRPGSLTHILIEIILLSIMSAIVVIAYHQNKKRKNFNLFFNYHRRLDRVFYPVLVFATIISLMYLLHGGTGDADSSWENSVNIILILIILLHLSAIFIIVLIWVTSKSVNHNNSSIRISQ
jgi:membrane-bound metal-dependent hydrolase YbcI (DUF457 family)